jgi:UDP-2-acetamido-3-amino-2,3-dideoxy-glucuronate N-acetyltransferase
MLVSRTITSPFFVHPTALCESPDIGPGTRIWAFAHVMSGARVGRDCNICDHSFIESGAVLGDRITVKNSVAIWDGVVIEDEVFIGPNVAFTNVLTPRVGFKKTRAQFSSTVVRRGASLGANATVVCGVSIGEYAVVGAGAVVTRDVSADAVVAGVPGRAVVSGR